MINKKTGKHYFHELFVDNKLLWHEVIEKIDLKQLITERVNQWLKRFEEEFSLEKKRNYSTSGDLFNEIENNIYHKSNRRIFIQKEIGFPIENPCINKNNLKFFQKRRVIHSMIPSSSNNSISNMESELFEKINSATPYKDKEDNYYLKENYIDETSNVNIIDFHQIIPCFKSFLRSVIDKKVEEIMREKFTMKNGEKLLNFMVKEQKRILYPYPVFKNLNFSTGPTNKQLFELDLKNRLFRLCLFKRSLRRGIWYRFIIQDNDTPKELRITKKQKNLEQKFINLELDNYTTDFKLKKTKYNKKPRLVEFIPEKEYSETFWKARNPTVVYNSISQNFRLHIPFEKIYENNKLFKTILANNTKIKPKEEIEEIVIGIDQGICWYAVVSVNLIKSKYRKTKEGKISREIIHRKPLRHYYLNDREIFGISLNRKTGLLNNCNFDNTGKFIKRKMNNSWGKGKFRILKRKIRRRQRVLMEQVAENNHSITGNILSQVTNLHPFTNDPILAKYWNKFQNVQKTLASNLAAKIRDIVVYYQTVFKTENPSFCKCPIRVQVEYLKWTKQKPKYKTGYFLTHNNIHFIHSQFQELLGNLLIEHGIGLWAVNPHNTSKICSICHYPVTGYRSGKEFYCSNPNHRLSNNKFYSCNADLNAARNISQFPPISLNAINTAKITS